MKSGSRWNCSAMCSCRVQPGREGVKLREMCRDVLVVRKLSYDTSWYVYSMEWSKCIEVEPSISDFPGHMALVTSPHRVEAILATAEFEISEQADALTLSKHCTIHNYSTLKCIETHFISIWGWWVPKACSLTIQVQYWSDSRNRWMDAVVDNIRLKVSWLEKK